MVNKKIDNCEDTPVFNAAELFCDSEIDFATIEKSVKDILIAIGEDPNREGLLATPARVSRAYGELLEGYRTDPIKLVNNAVFTANYDDLLEEAFKQARVQRRPVITDGDIPLMRRGGNVVNLVKLYGDLEQPKTVVLDRESYERFFTERPQMVKLLEVELARSTILYLGWSHQDPHFNLLFGQLLHHYGSMMRPGYAVMFGVTEAQRAELQRKGIHVIKLPAAGDRTATLAAWLAELLGNHPGEVAAPVAPPVAAPAVPAPTELTPEALRTIRDYLAEFPEFETASDRKTLLHLAGIKVAAHVDLTGANYAAAGRIVVFLAGQGDGATPPTPLGRLLRYLAAAPTMPPARRSDLQAIIDRYGQ